MPPSRTVAPYSPPRTLLGGRNGPSARTAPAAFHTGYQPARTLARRGQTPHQGDRRFPGETSCLTLVWAVLDLYITHAKNGVRFSQLERQRLRGIRHAGSQPTTDQEVTAA
jgi:hypothetical protein